MDLGDDIVDYLFYMLETLQPILVQVQHTHGFDILMKRAKQY